MEKADFIEPASSGTRKQSRLRMTASILCLLVASVSWLSFSSWRPESQFALPLDRLHGKKPTSGCSCCTPEVKAPRNNVWADLSKAEVDDILPFLYDSDTLNLTIVAKSTAWDNHISMIETLVPNKTDAVEYLDQKGVEAPARYARVTISHGSSPQASIDQYMVGPLPVSKDTTIEPLTFIYNSGRSYVETPMLNYQDLAAWFLNLGQEAGDFVKDLVGVDEQDEVSVAIMPQSPMVLQNTAISNWISVHTPGVRADAWSLLPQGLYVRFEINGRDKKDWKLAQWYYNGVLYNSTDAIRDAWKAGNIDKLPTNRDGAWTDSEPEEKGLAERAMPGPVMVIPGGKRWKVDAKNRFVNWMGFEFYYTITQSKAMSLWDIKFGGERIMYELGLQEAMAHYAGNDPMSIGMVWLDTLFGMGSNMYELVPGYDCPAYATYLDTTYHQGDKTVIRKNSVCIFEYTADHAIQRHTTHSHVTVSKNTYLIVRSVSTVGNYDYTIDYTFYLDGSMEVKVRASGYIFGAYHQLEGMRKDMLNKRSDMASYEYGYQIQDLVVSSMHDHVLNFKADLDIAGTANTLTKVDIAPHLYQYPWDDQDRKTMRLVHNHYSTETGLTWPPNSGAMYVVLNNETTNKWGEKRGYKVVPGTGMGTPPHLTIMESPYLNKAAAWAVKDLFVVKHHDEERMSASEYNAMTPADPLIDFEKMLNDENVEQEDLVIYFNLGTHHVPHSGDVPNTLMHTSSSSVMFIPHNFHDRDPSRKSANGAKLTLEGKDGKVDVKYYGGVFEKDVRIKQAMLEPNLHNYSAPEGSITFMLWNATLAAL